MDPLSQDLDALKQLYPFAIKTRDFHSEQLKIGLDKLKEMALQYTSIGDFELLKVSFEGIAGYFKIHPSLLGNEITLTAKIVLFELSAKKCFTSLTDNFLSNLIIESSSYYYFTLPNELKLE